MIVDAVQSQPVRWSHVGKEAFERLKLGRYFDAATSVTGIRRVVRVLAAAAHAGPDLIFTTACFPVCASSIPDFYGAMTSAGNCSPAHQFLGPYGFDFGSTVALAIPAGPASGSRRPSRHSQLSEFLASQVTETRARLAGLLTGFHRHADLVRSARLGVAVQKVRSPHGRFLAALAAAQPIRLTLARKCQPQYRQLAEGLTRQLRDATTAARDGVPRYEVGSANQFFFAALTSAMPAGFTSGRIRPSLYRCKPAEGSTCKVFCFPWHDLKYRTSIIGGMQGPCPAY